MKKKHIEILQYSPFKSAIFPKFNLVIIFVSACFLEDKFLDQFRKNHLLRLNHIILWGDNSCSYEDRYDSLLEENEYVNVVTTSHSNEKFDELSDFVLIPLNFENKEIDCYIFESNDSDHSADLIGSLSMKAKINQIE